MENLHVKIENPATEIVFREGTALPPVPPEKIKLAGNIKAISNFLSIRNKENGGAGVQAVDLSKAVLLVNDKDMSITLKLDPENLYGLEIVAKLELSDELKQFQINSTGTFTREQLIKLIRFNKIWFDDSEKHAGILTSYMAFNATANSEIEQKNDTRGNRTNNLQKTVQTNVPTEFILNIPVFKGGGKERFRVEICLDVTDGGARFWFESVELHELVQERKEEIFNRELSACEGFVIIYQ